MPKSLVVVLIALSCITLVLVLNPSYVTATDNSWVTRASMPANSYGGKAAVVDGKIYVIGGFTSSNNVYDPSTDTWTALTPTPNFVSMNGAMIYQNVVAYQNKIYYIGANATEVYDPLTDSWESKTPMPMGVVGSANIVNGEIYVISGYNYPSASQLLGINQVYNMENDYWTTKTSITYPVSAYASTVCDNKIYIIGGQDPDLGTNAMNVNFTQIYDPVNNSWSYGAPMLSPRVEFAVANVNDSLYVLGGSNLGLGAPYVLSNEQYFPLGYGKPDSTPTPIPNSFLTESWFQPLIITTVILAVVIISMLLFRRHRKTANLSK